MCVLILRVGPLWEVGGGPTASPPHFLPHITVTACMCIGWSRAPWDTLVFAVFSVARHLGGGGGEGVSCGKLAFHSQLISQLAP